MPAKTVPLDAHAMATLRYIRASMDAAGNVAVPGAAGIAMGLIGCAAMGLTFTPTLAPHWLAIWLAAAPIAVLAGSQRLMAGAAIDSFLAAGTPGRKLGLGLLPGLFAGAVMTAVLWSADLVTAIPGAWLLLYGCALVSASSATQALVAWMGASFVALGIVAFVVPVEIQQLLLGLGFGGLHIVFGLLIRRESHGRES